ncbi:MULTISPECIES: hypothetical protein [unclassified Campylobacter]|uniref:hypothetical protein n=1 Tax=unclassified Campylobacter TaxID=2593542 RepID=UPI00123808A3|nr:MULTISPECIES: hypothetical protein [unclassified Campylobacter]KAA6226044.1 hypothetical protein FMM55_05385 [Campylobacter sp. LR196d]KAA6226637.1 hypothetical protein FMM57_05565 [Campylobacter sp. LR286c]KAA6227567.1 hypothetical protein FMM54_02590 [Campylobacter sp. LR185c]KAA6230007.1 hypothetical protein FMM58_06700 [Campylobacter sp. LR291e]KAA8603306.1 hypothetical protein CGP82_07915 [Campylobacter sp. LR185c]
MINKNKLFRQIHIYLSIFFLPCALLYAITGICYISGIHDDVGMKTNTYTLNKAINSGEERLTLMEFLKENKLKLPKDELITNKKRKSDEISIGSFHYSASIAKNDENSYTITTQTKSLLGDMILLHKDKGAWYFSVMGIGFGLCMLALYVSGLIITFFAIKRDRNKQILTLIFGCAVTFLLGYISI